MAIVMRITNISPGVPASATQIIITAHIITAIATISVNLIYLLTQRQPSVSRPLHFLLSHLLDYLQHTQTMPCGHFVAANMNALRSQFDCVRTADVLSHLSLCDSLSRRRASSPDIRMGLPSSSANTNSSPSFALRSNSLRCAFMIPQPIALNKSILSFSDMTLILLNLTLSLSFRLHCNLL